jgi:hemerythrin
MLTWTPSLLIGVPWIDAQHQALFLRAERFAAASRAGEPGYRLEELFTFLSNYTLEHFAAEERYMREVGYPDLALLGFLDLWLTEHIGSIDQRIGDFVQNRGG